MAFGDYTNGATAGGNSAAPSTGVHGITINDGDLVVVYINVNSTTSITHGGSEGTAFTSAVDETPSGETARQALFWKVAGGSEPTSYTFASGNAQWRVCIKVFDGGTGVEVDAAAATGAAASNQQYLECVACNGETVADSSLSIVAGGKDNRATNGEAYTTADNSYVSAIGNVDDQMAGMAHRFFSTGETISFNMDIGTADGTDGRNDKAYSCHISFVESGGGPVINEKTLTDTLAVVDPARKEHELRRRDNFAVTDAISILADNLKTLLDEFAVTDNTEITIDKNIPADVLAVTDTKVWFRLVARLQAEGIDVTDLNVMLRQNFRELSDVLVTTDNVALVRGRVVAILDNLINVTDNAIATVTEAAEVSFVTKTDNIVTIDAAIELRQRFRALLDLVTVIDLVVMLRERNRALVDSIAVVDADVAIKQSPREILDALNVTDTSIPLRNRNWQLLDLIDVNDAAIELRQRFRALLDTIDLTDNAIATAIGGDVTFKTLTDTLATVDFIARQYNLKRLQQDTINVIDNIIVTTTGVIARIVSDALAVTDTDVQYVADALLASRVKPGLLTDAFDVSDALIGLYERNRVLTDNPAITDNVIATYLPDGILVNLRTLADQIDIFDSLTANRIAVLLEFLIKHRIANEAFDHDIDRPSFNYDVVRKT
jgi:hypothetical protein